jgi:hypothetical protein
VLGFERESLEDEKIEGALDEITWFTHTMIIYISMCRSSRYYRRQDKIFRC